MTARLLFTTLVLVSLSASAQEIETASGFALDRFVASDRGSDWFSVDSLDLRGDLRPAAGLLVDYAHKPLVIYNADGTERTPVVADQAFAHLGASLILANRLRLAVDLPVALGGGKDGELHLTQYLAPEGASLGDARASALVRIIGTQQEGFSLAAAVRLYVPTGSRAEFSGDGYLHLEPELLAAGDINAFTYAARVGAHLRGLHTDFDGVRIGNELQGGLAVGVRTPDRSLLVGPELLASFGLSGPADRRATSLEALLGVHLSLADWRLGAGMGIGITRGLGTPELRGLASIEWAPGADSDKDKDGIVDYQDACPNVPGPRSSDPTRNGCPLDSDGDGIPDAQDACPTVPGAASADPKKNGCPLDSDGDGIPDAQDACPTVPGAANSDAKKNGCPLDSDGDGIPDAQDACPTVPGVANSDPKKNGCPADSDGDGILDANDACPTVPGVANSDAKKNGCPPDSDGDGIADAQDACPTVPGVANADAKKNGCPPDSDGDGIADAQDACPAEPGVATADPAKNGCDPKADPDDDKIPTAQDACPRDKGPKSKDPKKNGCPSAIIDIRTKRIELKEQIQFETGSAKILPQSFPILQKVADIMTEYPDIKIRVEGHTDDRGKPEANKTLSKNRAASVVEWLSTKGKIARDRLSSEGYGQERPIDTNKTAAGRATNRRVEMHIVEQAQ